MTRPDIASGADRSATIGRLRGAGSVGDRRPAEPVREPDSVPAVAPKPARAPIAAPRESLRVDAADLAPLAGVTGEALLAEMVRLDHLVSRHGRLDGPDVLSMDVGGKAIRECIRRLRLVQAAGDSLIVAEG